jgi:hypothetical protein
LDLLIKQILYSSHAFRFNMELKCAIPTAEHVRYCCNFWNIIHINGRRTESFSTHILESEGFYIIDREFSFQYGGQKMVKRQEAFLYQKKDIPHTYKNTGKNVGRRLWKFLLSFHYLGLGRSVVLFTLKMEDSVIRHRFLEQPFSWRCDEMRLCYRGISIVSPEC